MRKLLLLALGMSPWFLSCKKVDENNQVLSSTFEAYSPAFVNGGDFPQKYTCDGLSISPPIAWKNAPVSTKGYAITMHHIPPTGDKHVYMCVYNISSNTLNFAENTTNIGLWGINTVNGKNTYSPPCSQGPGPKVYIITVYALSEQPTITATSNKITMDILLEAIATKTLAKSVISVTYSRL